MRQSRDCMSCEHLGNMCSGKEEYTVREEMYRILHTYIAVCNSEIRLAKRNPSNTTTVMSLGELKYHKKQARRTLGRINRLSSKYVCDITCSVELEPMNIYALKGHKVRITAQSARNGYDSDVAHLKEHLKLWKTYTVDETAVGVWSTAVILEEFPHERFNAVNFVDVTEQAEEDDMKHPDWEYYNK